MRDIVDGTGTSTATAAQIAARAAATSATNAANKDPFTQILNRLNANSAATTATLSNYNAAQKTVAAEKANVNSSPDVVAAKKLAADVAEQINKALGPGSSIVANNGSIVTKNPITNAFDAVDASLKAVLSTYGLKDVTGDIAKIRKDYPDISSDDMLNLLKFDNRYNTNWNTRFAGNVTRTQNGLQPLDPGDYLKAEGQYKKILSSYGISNLANQGQYAKFIGGDVSATELTTRVSLGYDRITKADPTILKAFNTYYPELNTGDVLGVMIDPKNQLPALQQKVQSAEIGGAALQQGLSASKATAEDLVAYGVDQNTARAGYAQIAPKLPRGQFLTQISGELGVNYDQKTAENIAFKKNAADIAKEQLLINTEAGRFSGQSGTSKGSFSTGYLNRASASGAF